VVNVVVSKLKRFKANELGDVAAMIERDLVSHAQLVARFQSVLSARVRDEEHCRRQALGAAQRSMVLAAAVRPFGAAPMRSGRSLKMRYDAG
jgi:hypothetical protein